MIASMDALSKKLDTENFGKSFSKRESSESTENAVTLENALFSMVSSVQTVALPSKMELAKQWFRDHPDDVHLTGRELSDKCYPMGVKLSHKYWNDAKKEL